MWPEPAGVNQCKSLDARADVYMGGGFAPVHFLCLLCGELSCLLGNLEVLWGLFRRANDIFRSKALSLHLLVSSAAYVG